MRERKKDERKKRQGNGLQNEFEKSILSKDVKNIYSVLRVRGEEVKKRENYTKLAKSTSPCLPPFSSPHPKCSINQGTFFFFFLYTAYLKALQSSSSFATAKQQNFAIKKNYGICPASHCFFSSLCSPPLSPSDQD